MPQDGGWIQLVEVPSAHRGSSGPISARAHLMVHEVTENGWRGRLESVRTRPLGVPLAAGAYIALFGPWSEPHVVELAEDASGPSITADGGEPSILRERADGH